MHVALIGSPTATLNGPARVTHGLAGGLAARGPTVTIYGLGDCRPHPHADVTVQSLDVDGGVRATRRAHKQAIADAQAADADVVHDLVHHSPGADVVTVQWTTTSIDLARARCWSGLGALRSLAGEAVLSVARRQAAAAAPVTVASSPETARQLRSYWRVQPDRAIPLGVPEDWLSPPTGVRSPVRVLFPGRISAKKGQEAVLRHLNPQAEAYEVRLVGAGDPPSKWQDAHEGGVSDRALRENYAWADIAVVPSIHENFGLTALEAMAHGTAVVATEAVGLTTYSWAQRSEGVYAEPSPATVAGRVIDLASSPGTVASACTAAYERARELTWPRIAARYEALYDRQRDAQARERPQVVA